MRHVLLLLVRLNNIDRNNSFKDDTRVKDKEKKTHTKCMTQVNEVNTPIDNCNK